ncbi:MAG TPA: hypothetical protein GYA08_03195 [Chloroflexi bacterium]|nr:hypothetical protein [Chloroflexota bacterium]
MLIAITATMIVAISFGAFIVLWAAVAMTRRAVEVDAGLEEQPLEEWTLGMPSTQLRLS